MGQGLSRVAAIEHRGHEHDAIGAHLFRSSSVATCLGGAAFGHSAQHLDAALYGPNHRLKATPLFFAGQRLVFAQGTQKNDTGNAGLDQGFRMPGRSLEIERLVRLKLSCNGGENSALTDFAHFLKEVD
jgi:hypothetical protein